MSKSSLLLLVLLVAGCSQSGPQAASQADPPRAVPEYPDHTIREVLVWNDAMPGKKPSTHMTMRVVVRNTTRDTIEYVNAECLILSDSTRSKLRKFPVAMSEGENQPGSVFMPPGREVELLFRTLTPAAAFDETRHPKVRAEVTLMPARGEVLRILSNTIIVQKTQ